MDFVSQLQRQYIDFLSSLYREGLVDDQLLQVQKLQDQRNPKFVSEVVKLFFDNSEKLLNDLASALEQQVVDYDNVSAYVHKFKSVSSSIGALQVRNICLSFKTCYVSKNLEGCLSCLQQLKDGYYNVKYKLQTLLRLEREIVAAGGVVPIMG